MYPRTLDCETGFSMAQACCLNCDKSSLDVIGPEYARCRSFKISHVVIPPSLSDAEREFPMAEGA